MEQRSTEWFSARLGCVTASRTADVMAKTKSGYSASRANYMAQLITERLTEQASEGFSSAAMQWGTETEPQARMAYEVMTGETVEETGFVQEISQVVVAVGPLQAESVGRPEQARDQYDRLADTGHADREGFSGGDRDADGFGGVGDDEKAEE